MHASLRLFLAVSFSNEVLVQFQKIQRLLNDQIPAGYYRWTRSEHLHMTIQFLGDTQPDKVCPLVFSLERTINQTPQFKVVFNEGGVFNRKGQSTIIWIGTYLTPNLKSLSGYVRICTNSVLSIEPDKFIPHVTLARVNRQAPVNYQLSKELIQNIIDTLPPVTEVIDRVTLYQSTLDRTGPTYTALHRFHLGVN